MKRRFPHPRDSDSRPAQLCRLSGLVVAPTDQLQGDVYRIIYYHVPSAWTAFLFFVINFVSLGSVSGPRQFAGGPVANWIVIAIGVAICVGAYMVPLPKGMYPSSIATTGIVAVGLYFLIRKLFSRDKVDALALVTAEVGVVFCTVVLVTGPLWARPVWGIWWAPGTSA